MVEETVGLRRIGAATVSGAFGSFLEFYTLYIAGFAAGAVWPVIFFHGINPTLAFVLSELAFFITYIFRPVGGFIFGHLGDKYGRRNTLVITLILVSVGTLLIGVTPGAGSVGLFAPVFITLMRVVTGIGLGGEYGGSATLISETARKSKYRYFWNAFVALPIGLGALVSTLTFDGITATMTHAAFLNIGWRYPFIIGGIIGFFGILIRLRVRETPSFEELAKKKQIEKAPALNAFRKHWKGMVIMILAFMSINTIPMVEVPYSFRYLGALGFASSSTFLAYAISQIFYIGFGFTAGILASLTGKKKLIATAGAAMGAMFVWTIFPLLGTLNFGLVALGMSLMSLTAFQQGLTPSILTENFPAKYRYTGVGFSLQMTSAVTAVIAFFSQGFAAASLGVIKGAIYVQIAYFVVAIISFLTLLVVVKPTNGLEEVTAKPSGGLSAAEAAEE